MSSQDTPTSQRADEAISARLRKLSAMPVDLSRLQAHIESEVPRQQLRRGVMMRLFRPIVAVAASITLFAVIATALLTTGSREVMASPAEMARFHRDIVANRIAVTKVDSIEAAGRVLADQWPETPDLPRAPEAHVMACCMKSIKDKKVACVLLSSEGAPITMSVANASDMKSPQGQEIMKNGSKYHLVTSDTLNMVSTERSGKWVCLIGEVAADRLMAIAEKLQF
jgi:hypothetical protein